MHISFALKLLYVENLLESVMLLGWAAKRSSQFSLSEVTYIFSHLKRVDTPPLTFRTYVGHPGRLSDDCAVLCEIILISCLLFQF